MQIMCTWLQDGEAGGTEAEGEHQEGERKHCMRRFFHQHQQEGTFKMVYKVITVQAGMEAGLELTESILSLNCQQTSCERPWAKAPTSLVDSSMFMNPQFYMVV